MLVTKSIYTPQQVAIEPMLVLDVHKAQKTQGCNASNAYAAF